MDKIIIEIRTTNAAFDDPGELSRILSRLAEDLSEGKEPATLRDVNGNTVGTVQIYD